MPLVLCCTRPNPWTVGARSSAKPQCLLALVLLPQQPELTEQISEVVPEGLDKGLALLRSDL